MPVDAVDECQGAHGILTICDGGNDFPECESQSSSEVSSPKRPWTVFDDPSICQNITYVKVDVINNDTLCFPDLDVGKEKWDTSKPGDETIQTTTSEHSLTLFRRALQKKISLQVGEKFMQFLMDSSLELPKFISSDYSKEVYDLSTAIPEFCKNVCPIYHVSVSFDKCMKERVFDTPTSRSRKYNRSVSFNSRRVGLLFSVL